MSFLGCRLCRAGKVLITGHRVAFTEKRPGVFSWKTFSLMPHAVHHPVLAQTSTRAASHGSEAWILCQEPPLGLRRRPLARRACMPSVPFTPTLYSARASEAHSCQRPDGMLSVCALCLCSLSVRSVSVHVALCLSRSATSLRGWRTERPWRPPHPSRPPPERLGAWQTWRRLRRSRPRRWRAARR